MDKTIKEALNNEYFRQLNNIELIASENYVSKNILELQGSIFTNKYAEGYPNKRYYGGCEFVDIVEEKAISYVCELFGCNYANVQAHSGSSANMAVYKALLDPKDKILSMSLNCGGHLTHGSSVSFSGKEYNIINYGLNKDEKIDYENIKELAIKEKPKLIIAGYSAYSLKIDFKKFREIADLCGAYLMVDMAHIAGIVAAGYHESPIPYADVVTSTTHKTLRGPRGGIILTNNEDIFKKVNKAVFPGLQGGPLMHVIAAKAQCFYEALKPEFKEYIKNVLKNAKTMCDEFLKNGVKIVSDNTENHLMLIDVKKSFSLTGKDAEKILDSIGITVNKNSLPFDDEKPNVTSGIRIGTAAMTTRGASKEDFVIISNIIIKALRNYQNESILNECRDSVSKITQKYQLFKNE